MGTLKIILVAAILMILLTGCDNQKKDAWAEFNATCAGTGYSTKSLTLARTYLFGFIPIYTSAAATCELPPLHVTETEASITKSSK